MICWISEGLKTQQVSPISLIMPQIYKLEEELGGFFKFQENKLDKKVKGSLLSSTKLSLVK